MVTGIGGGVKTSNNQLIVGGSGRIEVGKEAWGRGKAYGGTYLLCSGHQIEPP
jgi:hypothetical protein